MERDTADLKLYTSNDMARISCDNCNGCSSCCEGMGDTILLNPYDVNELCRNLKKTFQELLENAIELNVQEGMILPNLRMAGNRNCCSFLDENGRCLIHAFRPGLCRLFPLGRNYEEGTFQYFVVEDGCKKAGKSKVKINKWLDIPQLKHYEDFITKWHFFVKEFQQSLRDAAGQEDGDTYTKQMNLFILQTFFMKPYEENMDFYEQFEERLQRVKSIIG